MKILTGKLATAAATVLLTLALPFFVSNARALAQEEDAPQQNDARPDDKGQNNQDADLMRRLKLTPDQLRQIREIRKQNAEEMRRSRQVLIQAQLALDEAIYADAVNEPEVEKRAREVATAQAAVVRLRALTELQIRRVLTPEQLNTLREIRAEVREQDRLRRRERRDEQNAFQDNKGQNMPNDKRNPRILQQTQPPPAGTRGRRP